MPDPTAADYHRFITEAGRTRNEEAQRLVREWDVGLRDILIACGGIHNVMKEDNEFLKWWAEHCRAAGESERDRRAAISDYERGSRPQ